MDPFLGQISYFAFGFVPQGWALCNGQLLAINANNALFSLLGTRYGGDGVNTFGLPDLRGRVAMHVGPNRPQGSSGGAESVTLNAGLLPGHTHDLKGSTQAATTNDPNGALLAAPLGAIYTAPAALTSTAMATTPMASGGHSNLQPSLVLNACIAVQGIYPSRN